MSGIEQQGAGRVDIAQRPAAAVNGWLGVLVIGVCIYGIVLCAQHAKALVWLPIAVLVLAAVSLVIVTPGDTSVVQFFGRYIGTIVRPGFWLVVPLTTRRRVSIRVR